MRSLRIRLAFCLVATWTHSVLADQPVPAGSHIAGYVSQQSCVAGDHVELHVSTSAPSFDVSIQRYGAKMETVYDSKQVPGKVYAIPDRASSTGCQWPVGHAVNVPPEWKSGYYQVRLTAVDESGAPVRVGDRNVTATTFFILRSANPGKDTKILLQLSTNTYNAYTNWGGHSLYSYHDRDGLQGHQVSFQRPQNSQFQNWEAEFVRWAENNGYQLDYATNNDLEFRPELLTKYKLVLSVGHDEYWSAAMRDNLEAFIGKGGNVCFFSGNTCCWQVRNENQALTCWKQWYNVDPLYRVGDPKLLSTLWSHHLVGRPENQLTGVGFLWGGYHRSHGQFMDGDAAFQVHRDEHWVFAGSNLQKDGRFGSKDTIVGYECDGCEYTLKDGLPVPTHRDGTPETFTILATCPARWAPGDSLWYDRFPADRIGAAVMGVYTRGGTVFTAGSTDWAHGLRGNDPHVSQITKNLLERLSK